MSNEYNKIINKIRILADLQRSDSPKVFGTGETVRVKSGNSTAFEFLLTNNEAIVDVTALTSLTLEIFDIGSVNAPSPRKVKIIASKSVAKSDLRAVSSLEDFKNGNSNATFFFSDLEMKLKNGYKWLSLTGYMADGCKSTFAQGWIDVCEQYTSDNTEPPVPDFPYVRKDYADNAYLQCSDNLASVGNVEQARDNLSVYSKSEVDNKVSEAEDSSLKKSNNLSDLPNKAISRTNLDVYSKTEVDNKNSLLLKKSSNLSDLSDKVIARSNLDVYSKSESDSIFEFVENADELRKDVSYLMTAKANASALHVNNGIAKTQKKIDFPEIFTLAWRQKIPFSSIEALGTHGSGVYLGGLYSLCSVGRINNNTVSVCWKDSEQVTRELQIKTSSSNDIAVFDNQWHSICITFGKEKVSYYLDGSFVRSTSSTPANRQLAKSVFQIGNQTLGFVGEFKDVYLFNFDMLEESAPYTLADYVSGKSIPPLMLDCRSVLAKNYTSFLYGDYHTDLTFDTNAFNEAKANGNIKLVVNTPSTYTTDTKSVSFIYYKDPFKAGDVVTFKADDLLIDGVSYANVKDTYAMYYIVAINSGRSGGTDLRPTLENNWEVTATVKGKSSYQGVAIAFYEQNMNLWHTAGRTIEIVNPRLYVNGALVAFEDSINAVQVRDRTTNNNHASISGTILSDEVKNPAMCSDSTSFSWAGTMTTQKFLNSDSAILKNSNVIAYAKATEAGSFSFKCGSNAAQTKELSVNILTKIGEWLNDSAGNFTVTPLSTYTGSMEVYLKIEQY